MTAPRKQPDRGRARRRLAVILAAAGCVVALLPAGALAVPPSTINVEIDWMADGTHRHRPSETEMNAVAQMFACHGITFNYVIDDSLGEINLLTDGPNPNDFFTAPGANKFAALKTANYGHAGQSGWHYCIFGHNYTADGSDTTSSGLADSQRDDFIVTMGSFSGGIGTAFDRAGTFAHELGHNLGLAHAGNQIESVVGPRKPNYASIMSYQYQLTGVRTQIRCVDLADSTSLFKDLDYSNGRLPSIEETALSEPLGVGIRAVDWNCNGAYSGTIAHDLNGLPWCGAAGSQTTLNDYDDWANMTDITFGAYEPPQVDLVPCITAREAEAIREKNPSLCTGGSPALVSEACVNGQMIWVNPAWPGSQNGTGDRPYSTLMNAYNSATNGSVLYLQPGSLNTGGGAVLNLNKPLTLAGPGGATVTR